MPNKEFGRSAVTERWLNGEIVNPRLNHNCDLIHEHLYQRPAPRSLLSNYGATHWSESPMK
jgi:hypothetical protein